jgi:glyoxylase-like metal-dependent hydrolase (beta-lactamase superfamily II)
MLSFDHPRATVLTFPDSVTGTGTHVLACKETNSCVIIDPVLDFAIETANVWHTGAKAVAEEVKRRGWKVERVLETHAHADHLTASQFLVKTFSGASTGIGAHITQVQGAFAPLFNLDDKTFRSDASQWDATFKEGDRFKIGSLDVVVMETPGHTPACICYHVEGVCVFTGDTIFMPDMGTARCDFPGGSIEHLWKSIQRLLALPEDTAMFVGHDYSPGGRPINFQTTVKAQRDGNKHVHAGVTWDEFHTMRSERDKTLDPPKLILPSLQVNIRGGHFAPPESNGLTYIKLPVNKIGKHTSQADLHY